MNNELNLSLSETYDIKVERDRTLNHQLQCEVYSGCTLLGMFDFSTYTGATLEVRVRPNDFTKIISFSTVDNSIVLGSNGLLTLNKTSDQMNVRSGTYYYDMYISSSDYQKRGFLRGKFVIEEIVSI